MSDVAYCNAEDPGSIPVLGRSPGEGNGSPLQYTCLEKSHGSRSLVGYCPWGHKESDTTERLHFTSLRLLPQSLKVCSLHGSVLYSVVSMAESHTEKDKRDLPGSPVVKTLSSEGACV